MKIKGNKIGVLSLWQNTRVARQEEKVGVMEMQSQAIMWADQKSDNSAVETAT